MDVFGILDVPTWMLAVMALALSLYVWYKWRYSVFTDQGIPGPTPYPLIGTSLPLFTKGIIAIEKERYKKYGKVYGAYTLGKPMFVISDDEMLTEILVKRFWDFPDRRSFKMNDTFGSTLALLSGDDWERVRNLLTPTFSSGKLKLMMGQMNKCSAQFAANILKAAKDGEEFNTKDFSGCYTMDVIGSTAFGLEINSLQDPDNIFVRKAKQAMNFSILSLRTLVLFFPFLLRLLLKLNWNILIDSDAIEFFKQATQEAIARRKSETENNGSRTDFIQLMINAHNDVTDESQVEKEAAELGAIYEKNTNKKRLSEKEIVAQGILFFLAGYETTANTMAFTLYSLATNPEIQEKLYNEVIDVVGEQDIIDYNSVSKMQYLEMCVKETLRMFPPAPILTRVCKNDVTIKGVHIKKGQMVSVPAVAMHYDENKWKNPDVFDPERFSQENRKSNGPFDWLAFGYGPRNCIGMRLALLEAKIALAHVVRSVRLVPSAKTKVPLKFDKTGFRVKEGIWISANPRVDTEE